MAEEGLTGMYLREKANPATLPTKYREPHPPLLYVSIRTNQGKSGMPVEKIQDCT